MSDRLVKKLTKGDTTVNRKRNQVKVVVLVAILFLLFGSYGLYKDFTARDGRPFLSENNK